MRESSKASRRRCREASESKFPWDDIFKGNGVDVGSGNDPLPGATPIDLPDGGGDDLTKFTPWPDLDFVHSSQCLEHALNPKVMLQSWIDCLKHGGYIVATVPDWELYEKKHWPSKFNAGHRTRWTMDQQEALRVRREELGKRDLILLPQWLEQFPVEILLCRLIDTSDHSLPAHIDQTLDPNGAEVFIELVLRKK